MSVLRSIAIVAAIATAPVAWAQEPAAARTTTAGIYSSEQADRGQAVFDAKCHSCHGAEFEGGTLAPALKGSEFLAPFQGKPLRRIYSRIISTMPPDDIGSLTESETLTLVALVLRANGYSDGAGRARPRRRSERDYRGAAAGGKAGYEHMGRRGRGDRRELF